MNLAFYAPALSLAMPLALGVLVLRALGLRFAHDRLAYPAWVWLAGSLATAGLELLVLVLGGGTRASLVHDLAALPLAAVLVWLARERTPLVARPPGDPWPERALGLALVALALVYVLNQILYATLEPIYLDDEAQFWSERAKLLYSAGGFGPAYQAGLRNMAHADYPLLNPLLQTWIFVHADKVTHAINRVPIQLALPAMVLLLAGGARRYLRAPLAGLLVLAFVGSMMIPSVARRAHSDILVAFGGLVLLDAYLRWQEERRDAWLALAALGAAYLAWSKNEGLLVLAALALVAGFERWRAARAGRPLRLRLAQLVWLVPAATAGITLLHNSIFDLENDLVQEHDTRGGMLVRILAQLRDNALEVVGFFGEVAASARAFQLLPLALVVLVLVNRAEARRRRAALLVLALVLAGFVLVLISTPADIDWHLRTAGKRLLLQLYPSIALLVAVLMGRWLPPRDGAACVQAADESRGAESQA